MTLHLEAYEFKKQHLGYLEPSDALNFSKNFQETLYCRCIKTNRSGILNKYTEFFFYYYFCLKCLINKNIQFVF